jgi:membrane-bound ClpP family serine protease
VSENKKIVSANISDNSFELILRILGNEFIAIKIGSTNFSGKLIAGGVLLLFFTFIIMEMFGINQMIGLPVVE